MSLTPDRFSADVVGATTTHTVELVFDRNCPNVEATRAQLRLAMLNLGLSPRWLEWERGGPDAPEHVGGFGSPTVLINGHDVGGANGAADANCCRVYVDGAGRLRGVPSLEALQAALRV